MLLITEWLSEFCTFMMLNIKVVRIQT